MPKQFFLNVIFLAVVLASCTDSYDADTILFNGKVITVDKDFTIAEAVAIKGDRVIRVGSSVEIRKLSGPNTKKIDLHGKTVLPGLIDAHLHPLMAAVSELSEEIPDVHTLRELLEYIKQQAEEKEKGEWIIHPKFFPTRIKEMRQPTKDELDLVAPDHPVFLNGSYGGMINSCALRNSGIDRNTKHPGILKDPETGEPNGILRSSAFKLIKKTMPVRTISYEQELDALEKMIRRYNQVGLTGITDATQTTQAGIRKYLDLKNQNRLPIRINLTVRTPDYESREQFLDELINMGFYSPFGDEWVKICQLKTSIDGGILTGTAYLRQPWGLKAKEIYGIDDPGYRGILIISKDELFGKVSAANETGWKMTAHVTGGGGVDLFLDAYENANREASIKEKRHSIIHGNFFTRDAIDRCAAMGIISDMQPAWFYKDADAMKYILGEERIKTFLPARSMIEKGMILNGGSDHMVKFDSYSSTNPYNPFLGMWVLITRTTERGTVICADEAISRKEALKMYTINNAYGTFDEEIKGSIEPGKLADMIVISTDYLTCPVDSIRYIQVEQTILGGDIVYSFYDKI